MNVSIRAIDQRLFENAKRIKKFLLEAETELLMEYWVKDDLGDNRLLQYAELLNSNTVSVASELKIGDIFVAGL